MTILIFLAGGAVGAIAAVLLLRSNPFKRAARGTCRTCRHWVLPMNGAPKICARMSSRYWESQSPDSLAVAKDVDRFRAFVETHHTFSCCQWERIPNGRV